MNDKVFTAFMVIIITGVVVLGIWITFIADCSQLRWLPLANTPLRCLELKATTISATVEPNEINTCVKILKEAGYIK